LFVFGNHMDRVLPLIAIGIADGEREGKDEAQRVAWVLVIAITGYH